jgi:hypothetical protein
MFAVVENHLNRVRTAVLKRFTAAQIAKWVVENTKYAGQPYSFEDHEYQEEILNQTARETNVQKCSQVGVSEVNARRALGLVNVLRPYTVAYTLPTATFAATFMKTRIDTIIESSPVLKDAIHKTNDNTEIKQFGDSFLWLRGAASSNAPISIPCDHLIHDEFDFCDQEVLGQYQSRLTHSKWKRVDCFSTPTLPDFGINKKFKQSKRKFYVVKCEHCNHYFIPNYYDHVKVPGYSGDLREIDKVTLTRIDWQRAALHCPKCGKVPSLQKEHREWVFENPDENYDAIGLQVSPFDAPNIITVPYLVEVSTKYHRIQDFVNFNLGLAAEDVESTLMRSDFEHLFVQDDSKGGVAVMGVDVGNTYHFKIGLVDAWGEIMVIHTEKVGMGRARERYHQLRSQFRVVCSVIDSGPHSETVMALQDQDPNLFAAVYVRTKAVTTHTVVNKEEDKQAEKGEGFVRQVNINRNKALDAYMDEIRSNRIHYRTSEHQEEIITHHTSMKRVRSYDIDSQDMVFAWQKTDGNDHFHHTGVYLWIASKIMAVSRPTVLLPSTLAFTFKTKKIDVSLR